MAMRHVVRASIRKPWYSLAIVSVMAIATALLTTVLAIVDGVLFKPLGYPGEHQLFAIDLRSARQPYRQAVGEADLAAWTAAAPGVMLTGYRPQWNQVYVLPSFFEVFGVRPAIGGFAPEDFEGPPQALAPYILMDDVFQAEFGGDPNVIGTVVITNPAEETGYRIVGVMPRGFRFPSDGRRMSYLTPLVESRMPAYMLSSVVARLPERVSPLELESRILTVISARNADRPGNNGSSHPIDSAAIVPLGRALGADVRPLFAALLAAAGVLVVIGALNASSLLAARSVDRQRELAVRRALGATRSDIAKLLLMEAVLLLGVGTTAGLLLAAPTLHSVSTLIPDDVTLFRNAAIDWRVIGFSACTTAVLALLVVMWPFAIAVRHDVAPGNERGSTGATRSFGARLVITTQVAMALVLTVGGALLVGSLLSVYAKRPALDTDNIVTIEVDFTGMSWSVARDAPERGQRVDALLDRIRAVPGVDMASLTAYDLLVRAYGQGAFIQPTPISGRRSGAVTHAVTSGFYRTIQPHLIDGRFPTPDEERNHAPVLVVSERLAQTYWPGASAIGQTVTDFWQGRDATSLTFTIIGVVKDIPWALWDEDVIGTYYGPYGLLARQRATTLLVRSPRTDPQLTAELQRVIKETDPLAIVGRVTPLESAFVDSVRPRRFRAWLFGSFAAASLAVVGLGIFGQLAMSTARRTREVGVRMALGATRGAIARLIVKEQLVPVAAGLVAGTIAAMWATRFVLAYLYGVTAGDLRVWIAAIVLIAATAVTGTLIPSMRASRINPNDALRAE